MSRGCSSEAQGYVPRVPNQRKQSLVSILVRLEPELLARLDQDVADVKKADAGWNRTARIRQLINMYCTGTVPVKRGKV